MNSTQHQYVRQCVSAMIACVCATSVKAAIIYVDASATGAATLTACQLTDFTL